ncbi:MAG: peptidylprolyl isomerase [Chloroflexi bacterium]|nr:peptidylprolyl isomerase [Chloroflexota bacterium]
MVIGGCAAKSPAGNGDTVKVDYTGTLDDGTQFDSSAGREPLQFTLGEGKVIPGFEKAVLGMKVGDAKTVKIPSAEAYGPYHDQLMLVLDRSQLPADLVPEVGQTLQMEQDGRTFLVNITAVSTANITVDGNHPLAGKDLTFEITLVEIVPKK